MNRGELISELAASLGARHEARFIVDDVRGASDSGVLDTADIDTADIETARALAARRRAGEPLQYVLGHWAFRSLDLLVDPRVLIPRPETEQVVEVALREVPPASARGPKIVDAGTGSGAIALSLATELLRSHPAGCLWATDTSPEALIVARANLNRVTRLHHGAVLPVAFVEGFWLDSLPVDELGSIDLVVANPPYVATEEWTELSEEVRAEPLSALVAGDGTDGTPGLGDVEAVLTQAWAWLARPGSVVIELAPQQADAAAHMARAVGFRDVRVEPDLAQRPRALVGRAR